MPATLRLTEIATARLPWRRDIGRPIAFMHVPKTAGTSIMSSLTTALRPRQTVRGFDRSLFGDFEPWESMTPAFRRNVYLTPQAMPEGAHLVIGHIARSTLAARFPRARLVTFLREPRSRLLSHYVFWRCHTDKMLAPSGSVWAARVAIARGGLDGFLRAPSIAAQTDNVLTRMLLWPHANIPDAGFIDPAHDAALLDAARVRLAGFDYVGYVEASGGIYPGFAAWLDRPLVERRLNAARPVPPGLEMDLPAALTPETQLLLEARSRLDLALWQRIVEADHDPQALGLQSFQNTVAKLARRLSRVGTANSVPGSP